MAHTKCRWLCHNCKTCYEGGGAVSSLKSDEYGNLPSIRALLTWVGYIDTYSDEYAWHGTMKEQVNQLMELARWRKKHKGHKLQILKQLDSWPDGTERYKKEK